MAAGSFWFCRIKAVWGTARQIGERTKPQVRKLPVDFDLRRPLEKEAIWQRAAAVLIVVELRVCVLACVG